MRLDSAFARLADRMGIKPPLAQASRSERVAFEHHLLALGEDALSLDPQSSDSLILSAAGSTRAYGLSEEKAIDIAKAYGVEVAFMAELPDLMPAYREGVHGLYQEALPQLGRVERILILESLGAEARATVLWHEIGHLVLGHSRDNVPATDLVSSRAGSRSQEYLANAFAGVMIEQTVGGAHTYIAASSRGYMERFESAFESIHNPNYDPKSWDAQAGVSRAQEFLAANREMLLSKVAEVKQVG